MEKEFKKGDYVVSEKGWDSSANPDNEGIWFRAHEVFILEKYNKHLNIFTKFSKIDERSPISILGGFNIDEIPLRYATEEEIYEYNLDHQFYKGFYKMHKNLISKSC